MPRIETEFDVDMVFCFGIRLAPYAVFFQSDLPSTHCMTCCKLSPYRHRVSPSVRPSARPSIVSL